MIRYAIITNPVSGKMPVDQKRSALAGPAEILNSGIHGLETVTPADFRQCAKDLAEHHDVLVAAGGDGTLSDVVNAIDSEQTAVAFLPLGSGNAMSFALGYRGGLAEIAIRIRDGKIRAYDLVNCDEKKRGFMVAVGIDGTVLQLRNQYVERGATGFSVYLRAFLASYFGAYKRPRAEVVVDGESFLVKKLLTLAVVKQPYYGYGMKVVPKARFDDSKLHILCVNSSLLSNLLGAAASFTFGNPMGQYRTGGQLTIKLAHPLVLQVDGNEGWVSKVFTFKVMPKALRIKC
jgi:diacylglycerol kinase (ATP)